MSPQLLIVIAIGGGLFLILLLAIFLMDDSSAAVEKRLARVGGEVPVKSLKETTGASLRRSTTDSDIPFLDKLIKTTLPNPEKMRQRLARTGKTISLGEYLIMNLLAVLIFFFVFFKLVGWSDMVSMFMGIAAGLYLPHMIIGRMGDKRVLKFLGSFPEAIDTICRGLRSGLPISETITTVANELPAPIGPEFLKISDGIRMGRSLEEAMWEVAPRIDTPEFRFFIIALAIQRETGGNLAETLGNLGDLLRKRRQLKMKIRAMSSEARASAMIIGSLPFLMFILLLVVNADYIMTLVRDERGNFLLGGGLTWMSIGIITMKQMIAFEV